METLSQRIESKRIDRTIAESIEDIAVRVALMRLRAQFQTPSPKK